VADGPWYGKGLHFECRHCGNCCTGSAGTVLVSDLEIAVLARAMGMVDADFRTAFTRRLRGGDISLRERRGGDCVFYDRRAGCRVYAVRPRQCRTWPFWNAVLHSRESWEEEAERCAGMNRGPIHAAAAISTAAAADGTSRARSRPGSG
jgi:Fe-S-cluster containining protein